MANDRNVQSKERIANEPQQNFPLSRRGYEKLRRELAALEERWKEEWAELDSVTDPDDRSEALAAEWESRTTKAEVEERIGHLRLVLDHATDENVKPWLPLADNWREVNVEVQRQNPTSTLNFYKRLLHLRRTMPALHRGKFTFVDSDVPEDVLAYVRWDGDERVLIVINFESNTYTLDFSELAAQAELLLSSQFRLLDPVDLSALPINPHEGVMLQLK